MKLFIALRKLGYVTHTEYCDIAKCYKIEAYEADDDFAEPTWILKKDIFGDYKLYHINKGYLETFSNTDGLALTKYINEYVG